MNKKSKEKTGICKFIKCLSEKNYAEANKYLKGTVESKIISKMENLKKSLK